MAVGPLARHHDHIIPGIARSKCALEKVRVKEPVLTDHVHQFGLHPAHLVGGTMTCPWKYPLDVKFGKRFVEVATLGSLCHLVSFASLARGGGGGDHTIAPVQLQLMPLRGVNSGALLRAKVAGARVSRAALPMRATAGESSPCCFSPRNSSSCSCRPR